MPRFFAPRSPSGLLRSLRRQTRGATAIEYGLIVALIALGAAGGMSALGQPVTGMFAAIGSNILAAR